MSLEAMLDAIRASGQAQVSEIEAEARKQVEAIQRKADEDAARLREAARLGAVQSATRERARITRQARFSAVQAAAGAQEALVAEAVQRTEAHLAELRADRTYPAVYRRLVEEALAELKPSLGETEQMRVEADPRDRALLEPILHSLSLDVPVAYTLTSWGGLIASSEDGRIVVRNTLEVRLERAMPYLRRGLSELLKEATPAEASAIARTVTADA